MTFLCREEAKATAASAALSRILQGAVKPIVGKSKKADLELGHKGPQVGRVLEVQHINSWSIHKEVASRGDNMSGRDVETEQGIVDANIQKQHVPLVDEEKVVGQGSRARVGIKMREEKGNAWEGLAFSPQKGVVVSGDGDNTGVNEGEVQLVDTLAHGIRVMEDIGRLGPRWVKREDFGAEDLSGGLYNLCI